MTAHCRPEQYVTDADIEEAADIYIIAHESSPSIMVTLAKIAAKIHEQRSNSASPPLIPAPLRVEEENPLPESGVNLPYPGGGRDYEER